MDFLTNKLLILRAHTLLLPLCLAFAPLSRHHWLGVALLCAAIFLAVGLVPAFRHWESLAMFLIVGLCTIPTNLYLVIQVFWEGPGLQELLSCGLVLAVLFSLEELCFGLITRLIWRRQYKVSPGLPFFDDSPD